MKINKLFGAAVLAGALSLVSAFSVFAAEGFTVGKPIDLATGEVATDLKKDMHIAVPVDVTTSNGKMAGYGFFTSYDSSLTPGVVDANLSDDEYGEASALGVIVDDGSGNDIYVDGIFSANARTGVKTQKCASPNGTSVCNPAYHGNEFMVAATYNVDTDYAADAAEFYLLFTVASDFDSSKLNAELLTIDTENTVLKATNDASSAAAPTEQEKVNACAGAFNIKIDSTELKQFVHGVSIKVDGGAEVALDACKEDGDIYILPVRLTSATKTSGTASVQVILKVADTDTEGATTTDLVVPTPISVTLGAPTSYTDSAVTIEAE